MNPCYDCTVRFIGCHGVCEKYLEAKRIMDAHKKMVRNDPVRGYTIEKAAQRDPARYERARYH